MALFGLAALIAAVTLGLCRFPRWSPWFLGVGIGLFTTLYAMGRLRIPWPDLGLWTVFPLNPYLFLTLSFVLMTGGAVGVVVRLLRR